MNKTALVLTILFMTAFIMLSFINLTIAQNSDNTEWNFIDDSVCIANICGGNIDKNIMLNSDGIKLTEKASSIYRIICFRMILEQNDLMEFEVVSNGSLSEAMKNAIKEAPVGTKVWFEFIRCLDKDDKFYTIYQTKFILR